MLDIAGGLASSDPFMELMLEPTNPVPRLVVVWPRANWGVQQVLLDQRGPTISEDPRQNMSAISGSAL